MAADGRGFRKLWHQFARARKEGCPKVLKAHSMAKLRAQQLVPLISRGRLGKHRTRIGWRSRNLGGLNRVVDPAA